jgi:sugar transferase (PEP-CTERM/EpsH1 system associated)
MKILWVKAGGLVPLDMGGKIRSYHILKELARRHEATLFTFYGAHENDSHAQLDTQFSKVIHIPLILPPPGSLREFIHYSCSLLSSRPYTIAKFCRPEVAEELRRLLRTSTYDVIVCDFAIAGGVIPWEYPSPKVLFTHNVEAMIWRRHFQVARNPFWKAVCWREYHAMARAERAFLRQADRVLTVSENDRDYFARLVDPSKIGVIPTGVDTDYFQPEPGEKDPQALVFTGAMDWKPNEDGILYFVEQILPRIHQQIPQVTLWVVGRKPSDRLQGLARRDGRVRVTGLVDDIRPYVRKASVYIVPLRVGSGTRLKIFEAMAMGKAIVATSIGAEGLPVTHERDIILVDEPEEFSARVIDLLKNPHKRHLLEHASRELVVRKYNWETVAAHFESVLGKLTEATAPSISLA